MVVKNICFLGNFRNKIGKYQQRSQTQYELDTLKALLGVTGKYHDFRNFKKRILDVICKEINEKTSLSLTFQILKEGRQIKQIQFEFWEKGKNKKTLKETAPTLSTKNSTFKKLTVEKLSFTQLKAFQLLTRYPIKIQLALDMVAKVQGSEMLGFQDWYFEEVLRIFEAKTNQTTAAAKKGMLVNCFLKQRIFEQGDHFAVIMERLQSRKKQLQLENTLAWENRLLARNKTAVTFRALLSKQ